MLCVKLVYVVGNLEKQIQGKETVLHFAVFPLVKHHHVKHFFLPAIVMLHSSVAENIIISRAHPKRENSTG